MARALKRLSRSLRVAAAQLLVLLSLATAWPFAHGQGFDEGVAHFDRREYPEAFKIWLSLAEQGNMAAAFNVAAMLHEGLGVEQDSAQAAAWYRRAAEKGDLQAQFALGLMLADGAGVPSDPQEARRWLGLATRNPATGPDAVGLRDQADRRMRRLPPPSTQEVAYDGGRFIFTETVDGQCVIALQGQVTRDASRKFHGVTEQGRSLGCRTTWVLLESRGGSLEDGLSLGKEMRFAGFRTIVRSTCASSCGLIFLGGIERVLFGPRARIGFHQASVTRDKERSCVSDRFSRAYREIRSFLNFVSDKQVEALMNLIVSTSCDKMSWVSGAEAMELGVATKVSSRR